jgi:putative serine protease PepD
MFEPPSAKTGPLPPPFGYSYGEPPRDLGPSPTSPTKAHSLRKRGAAAIAAAALAAGLLGGGTGAAATWYLTRDDRAPASSSSLDAPPASSASHAPAGTVQQVASKVLPSVVSITIATPQGNGYGSGVILSPDGLILTNNHVVEPAQRGAQLSVTFNDGTNARARIVGLDPVTDLAVIRAEGVSGLRPAQLGRSADLSVGQPVVAIGSPLGLSGTVTSGIVSALNRPVRTDDSSAEQSNTVIDAIQTDAAINPGNSGGALVDMAGQIVGINTAIATLGASMGGQAGSIGVGFAIPIDQARPVAKQLIETGRAEHAQLGVSVSQAFVGSGVTEGAQIQSLTPNGAAEAAGLRRGDVITKVDDRLVPDPDALIAAVRSHRPGDKVTLTYVRDGKTHTTTATLGSDRGQTPRVEEQEERERLPFPWSR